MGGAVDDLGLDLVEAATPVLAPGFGAQGGTVESLAATFGAAQGQVLASSSREILGGRPDPSRLVAQTRRASSSRCAADARAEPAPGRGAGSLDPGPALRRAPPDR